MLYGLTGGIGSGKSTIARQLRQMGYDVYDSDSEAKRIIMENADVHRAMEELFGADVFAEGIYRTEIVAAKVFNRPDLMQQLNRIVHPAVLADIARYKQAHGQRACFVESAILYESGIHTLCDRVVAVVAPKKIRIERVVARDNADTEQVKARIKTQMSNCQLRAHADYIVENDGKKTIEQLVDKLIIHLKI